MIIRVHEVSLNSPKHRVWKGKEGDGPYPGLWNASRNGVWVAAYGSWERALRAATEGRL